MKKFLYLLIILCILASAILPVQWQVGNWEMGAGEAKASSDHWHVAASADDVSLYGVSGSWTLDALNNVNGFFGEIYGAHYGEGIRWTNVAIPQGATITSAYITFRASSAQSGTTCNAHIIGDDEDDAATFSTKTDFINRRGTIVGGADNTKRTTAEVEWHSIGAWTLNSDYDSPDISSVIQEIVNRAGWASGNALALFVDDYDETSSASAIRYIYTRDGSATYQPKLTVSWTIAAAITTLAATSVSTTSATLNGNITDLMGGGNITNYGLVWSTSSHAHPGDVPPASNGLYEGNWTSETVNYGVGQTFSHDVTSLSKGSCYYFRAAGNNTWGWAYGIELTFLTLPDVPSSASITAYDDVSISWSWTKGAGAGNTSWRYKTGSYPSSITDGASAYYGTGNSSTLTGLAGDTLYYFAGWSVAAGCSLTSNSSTSLQFTQQTYPRGYLFLDGHTNRIEVQITENGGGAKSDYAVMFDALYSGAIIEDDSLNQFLYRPAVRYVGTHDRTYIVGVQMANGKIMAYCWDEDDLTLSAPVELHDWAAEGTNDHAGSSVIVLQNQTGNLTSENGTILEVSAQWGDGASYSMYSRRSDNVEDISSWGDAVVVDAGRAGYMGSIYPYLVEHGNGTIECYYMANTDADDIGVNALYYRTLTLNANPDSDTWSAATDFAYLGDYSDTTYMKGWFDGNDTHFAFCTGVGGAYDDIYYIKHQASDNTWRTGNGTQKYPPFDAVGGNSTPDFVYDTGVGHNSVIWDIKTDDSNNPYIIFIDFTAAANGDIYRSYYSASWQNEDTGIDTRKFGGDTLLMAGAELDEGNVNRIYAAVPDAGNNTQLEAWEKVSGTWYIADGDNGTTAIAVDGKITQGGTGDNFRPIHVLHGGGYFELIWFYSEIYNFTSGPQSGIRLAYPGFSNQYHLCLNKSTRTDFGDLTMTLSDGGTTQPSASSGKPWMQEKTDSWRAILWWKIGNIPASGGNITRYIYSGNSTSTNSNSQTIMDAQFIESDHFDTGSLDTTKWIVASGDISQSGSNLELIGTTGTMGRINGNTTTKAAYQYAEARMKVDSSDSAPGYNLVGLGQQGTTSTNYVLMEGSESANFLFCYSIKDDDAAWVWASSQDTANWHIWRAAWVSSSLVNFYDDVSQSDNRKVEDLLLTVTDSAHIPTTSLNLFAREANTATGTTIVDWIFSRPVTYPEPSVEAMTTEIPDISNTPSSWDAGIVQPSSVYPSGLDEFTLTNNSSFPVNVSISAGNATGGTPWELSDTATPGSNVFGLKAGNFTDDLGGNWTVKSSVPVNASGWSLQRKVARDSTGVLYTIYHRIATKRNIFISYSDDDGQTWTEEQITSDASYDQYFPAIAIDSGDNIHICWYGKHSGSTSYFQLRYIKGTIGSWEDIGNLTSGDYNQSYSAIAIDSNDYVHIVWYGTHAGSPTYNQIRYIKYTDSWQSIENLTSSADGPQIYGSLAIDSEDNIHVAWVGKPVGGSYSQLRYVKYSGSWGAIQDLTSGSYGQDIPSVAVDAGDNVHITWFGQHAGSTSYSQVRYIKYSTSWSAIQNLTSGDYDQIDPMISVDLNNDIHIIWWGVHAGSPSCEQVRHISYTGSWSEIGNITGAITTQGYPNIIWARGPVVSGLRPNTPASGFAFVWVDGTTLTYYQSSGLEWDSQYNIVVKQTPTYNNLVASLAAAAHIHWGIELLTPTNNPFSDGTLKTATVTLAAEAS